MKLGFTKGFRQFQSAEPASDDHNAGHLMLGNVQIRDFVCKLVHPAQEAYLCTVKFTIDQEQITLLAFLQAKVGYASTTKTRKVIKSGRVKVDGNLVKIPSTQLTSGQTVELLDQPIAVATPKQTEAPFKVLFEDDNILAYLKPDGWITAHSNAKMKTTYTAMKRWMESKIEDPDLHFVNKVEKDASGIAIIAKSLKARKDLQDSWKKMSRRYYIMVHGEPEKKGVFKLETFEDKEVYFLPYENLRSNGLYSVLRVETGNGVPDSFEGDLQHKGTQMLGFGKMKESPLGAKGKHLFSVEFELLGKDYEIKTQVPKSFLKLVK